jgi:DEAD/DEAH box helicase domain-containing protein
MVEELDIENRKCHVSEADVNYYTDGVVKTDIKVLTEDEEMEYAGGKGVLSDVLVRTQVTDYKKIKFRTEENIGYGKISLPEEETQTRSLVLLFPPESAGGIALQKIGEKAKEAALKKEKNKIDDEDLDKKTELARWHALSGMGTLIRNIAPLFLLCDPRDLGIAERVRDPRFEIPALYIYDKYPGGTGLTESLSRRIEPMVNAIKEALMRCPCENGCPSCVGAGGNKAAAREFLNAL